MSTAELMRTVAGLPADQQNKLAAFLQRLRMRHDAAWRKEMARRLDDRRPGRWVSLGDWKKKAAKS